MNQSHSILATAWRDHKPAMLIPALAVYGLFGNALIKYMEGKYDLSLFFLELANLLFMLAAWVYTMHGIRYGKWRLPDIGLTLGGGFWINVACIVAFSLLGYRQTAFHELDQWLWNPGMVVINSFEELVFRAVFITYLAKELKRVPGKFFLAVIISSAVFVVPHFSIVPIDQILASTLQLAIINAVVFYFTKSLLFPMYFHLMMNLSDRIGFTAGAMAIGWYLILAVLGWYLDRRRTLSTSCG